MSKQGGSLSLIKNGPVKVTLGATVLGHTFEGVEVEIEGDWNPLQVDEWGEGWADAMKNADGILVTLRLPEFATDRLESLMPGSTEVIDGSKKKVTHGRSAGYRASDFALSLRIHPIALLDSDKSRDLLLYKAFVVDGLSYEYQTAEITAYEVQFRGLIDSARDEGDQLFSLGDDTAALDITPPTITLTSPLNDASGVVVSANAEVTFSEAMDEASVLNEDNVVLFERDSETPVAVTLS